TTTNAKGQKEASYFEWILDKSFVRVIWKAGDDATLEIFGIDPENGRWSYWGFDNQGRVYKGLIERAEEGEWTLQSTGHGKGGPRSLKGKDARLGADKERFEIIEFIQDGKKQPAEVFINTRTKDTPRPNIRANKPELAKKDITAAEKTMREFADGAVGGVWVPFDPPPGFKQESRFAWVLDGALLE